MLCRDVIYFASNKNDNSEAHFHEYILYAQIIKKQKLKNYPFKTQYLFVIR